MKQIAIRVRSGPEYPFGAIQGASVLWLGRAYRAAYAPNPKLSLMVGDGRQVTCPRRLRYTPMAASSTYQRLPIRIQPRAGLDH